MTVQQMPLRAPSVVRWPVKEALRRKLLGALDASFLFKPTASSDGGGGSAIPDSVVNRWPYEDGSGTVVTDTEGSNDGTVNGATWTANSERIGGYALQFDGSSAYISHSTIPRISTDTEFGVSGTFQTNTTSNQAILHHQTADSNRFGISVVNGNLAAGLYNGSDWVGAVSTGVSSGTLYRYIYGYDGSGNGALYVNASAVSDTGETPRTASGVAGFEVGRVINSGTYFDGEMDEIMIHDQQPTAQMAQDDYDRQPWTDSSGPVDAYAPRDASLAATDFLGGQKREKTPVIAPGVLDSDWHLWVARDHSATSSGIEHYTSSNGLSWTADSNNPVLTDSFDLDDPEAQYNSQTGEVHLYCERAESNNHAVAIYTSSDGVNWTFQSEELASYACQSPVVTIVGGTWYLFYEQLVSYPRTLRYATSTDGINFTDQGEIYQDPETDGTQGATVCDSIIQDPDGTWYMWYHLGGLSTDTDPHLITSDTISNGGNWTKASGEFVGTSNWESTYPVVHNSTIYYYVWDQNGDRNYDIHTFEL